MDVSRSFELKNFHDCYLDAVITRQPQAYLVIRHYDAPGPTCLVQLDDVSHIAIDGINTGDLNIVFSLSVLVTGDIDEEMMKRLVWYPPEWNKTSLPEIHKFIQEKQARCLELLSSCGAEGLIVFSGEIHVRELSDDWTDSFLKNAPLLPLEDFDKCDIE